MPGVAPAAVAPACREFSFFSLWKRNCGCPLNTGPKEHLSFRKYPFCPSLALRSLCVRWPPSVLAAVPLALSWVNRREHIHLGRVALGLSPPGLSAVY